MSDTKTITLYAYDSQLRPGTIGADFESGNPDERFTRRYEDDEAVTLMQHALEWIGAAPKKRTAACYPTSEEINALPDKFRKYIHDLETRTDKSGDVQTMALLREDRDALQRRVEELEAEVKRLRRTR